VSVIQSEGRITSLALNTSAGWTASYSQLGWTWVPRVDRNDGGLGDYAAIYRTQPNVRTVVSFLARNIAQLGLHAFRRVSDTERDRLPQTHELSKLLDRPHRTATRYSYIESLVIDLGVWGNHYALKVKDPDSGLLKLFRIPPQNVGVKGDWLEAATYVIRLGGQETTVAADAVFHLAEYNPDDTRIGASPLESLRRILAEDIAAGEYRESFWNNAARIEGVLQTSKTLSPDAARRLRDQWQALYSGSGNSGRTAILEEGLEFKETSFNAKDSEYLGARKLTREEVASAYHVSPAMVGILEHANFANISEQHKMLYQDTLGPRLVMIEEEFERQVLPDIAGTEDVYLEFNIDEKLKGSFEEQAAALQSSVGAPYVTRNEARARRNLKPIPGGDEIVTPLNVLIGGQASPQDSAPKMLRELADRMEQEAKAASNGHSPDIGALR
jgi:HK97 family phage portal protein